MKRYLMLFIIIVLFITHYTLHITQAYAAVGSNWFNEDWHYREPITITNNGSSALVDFQVQVTADTSDANKFKASGCSDIRFTDAAGNALNYWIESGANTATTLIWVKIAYIPTGASTIYMYYGNPDAQASESGDDTFEFFDDFSGSTLDATKWSTIANTGTLSVTSGYLRMYRGIGQSMQIESASSFSGYKIIEYRQKILQSNYYRSSIYYGNSPNISSIGYSLYTGYESAIYTGDSLFPPRCSASASTDGDIITNPPVNEWFTERFTIPDIYLKRLLNGVTEEAATRYSGVSSGNIGFHASSSSGYAMESHTDWIFARKYTSTEATAGAPGTEEVSPGPVAYWKFDEATSGTANGAALYDMTTNSNNGTGNAGADTSLAWATGKFGGALSFDGADDYVGCGNKANLNITAAITVEAWVKFNVLPSEAAVNYPMPVCKSGAYHIMGHKSLARVYSKITDTDSSDHYVYFAESYINTTDWFHIAITYDGTTQKIYLNGVVPDANGTGTWSGTIKTVATNVNMGGVGSTSWFNGLIDEVRIYDYARSAEQVMQDYNEGAAAHFGAGTKGTAPVAHWRFDECHGSTAYDQAGANNGTLSATPAGTNTTAEQMWEYSGKFGSCLEFDGADDYVQTNSFGLSSSNNTLTYETWMYSSKSSTMYQTFLSDAAQSSSTGFIYTYRHINSDYIVWQYSSGSGAYSDLTSSSDFLTGYDNQWVHIAIVVDYTNKTIDFYRNGIFINRDTTTNTMLYPTANRAKYFGRYSSTHTTSLFNGLIDEAKIYNRALSADEVMVEYNAGFAAHLGAGTDTNQGNPPVAWWEFNEGTGTTYTYDRSGNANNGTLTNMEAEDWVMGKYGPGLQFDGSNEYVNIGDVLDISTNDLTLEAWIKPSTISPASNAYVISKADTSATDGRYTIGMSADGKVRAMFDPGASVAFNGNIALTTDWNHIAAVYDRDGNLSIYVDGIYDTGQSIASGNGIDYDTSFPLRIGAYTEAGGPTLLFPGLIDDVKIYNYARTPAQIAWDYNQGAPVAHWRLNEGQGYIAYDDHCKAEQGNAPVGLWRMDEASSGSANGQAIYDLSGEQNHGTANYGANLTGMTWTTGKIGPGALSFDGADDYVDCGDVLNIYPITIEAWIKTTTSTGNPGVVNKYVAGSLSGYQIYIGSGRLKPWYFVNSSNYTRQDAEADDGGLVNDGNWHHIVYTVDAAGGKIYVDGAFINGKAWTGTPGATTTTQDLRFGVYSANYFNGLIDNVRIYNYARTAEQIKEDYEHTHGYMVNMDQNDWAAGKYGFALDFDGTNDNVTVSDNDNFDCSVNDRTYVAWIKIPTDISGGTGTIRAILNKYPTAASQPRFDLNILKADGHFLFTIESSTNGDISSIEGNTDLRDNQWHHVVAVRDRSADVLRIYVDGIEDNTAVTDGDQDGSNTGNLYIGDWGNGLSSGRAFDGSIDDVRIYNYARTPLQILQDYNEGAAAKLGD